MTTLAMNYTVMKRISEIMKRISEIMKRIGNAFIESRISHGKAVAAAHLSAMGYHEEARRVMLDE